VSPEFGIFGKRCLGIGAPIYQEGTCCRKSPSRGIFGLTIGILLSFLNPEQEERSYISFVALSVVECVTWDYPGRLSNSFGHYVLPLGSSYRYFS